MLSKQLLGKYLCVKEVDGSISKVMITETEAYKAPEDKASHAYNNRRTNRTEVMFNEGGVSYVYLCYGIHHLFNIVTGLKEEPHAILVRAAEPVENVAMIQKRRGIDQIRPQLTAGPGVLTKALGINLADNHISLITKERIWIEDGNKLSTETDIIASPRVGIDYAGDCVDLPWRFRIKDSVWTSKPN